jgi:acetyl-CoA synthetase
VVDTRWQTETGAILDHAAARSHHAQAGSATRPFGIAAEIRTDSGEKVEVGGGLLALTRPWPSMLRGIYGDPDRYVRRWNKWGGGVYVTGDGAKRDADGYFWLLGRVDDVISVAGHRLGTMEVERAGRSPGGRRGGGGRTRVTTGQVMPRSSRSRKARTRGWNRRSSSTISDTSSRRSARLRGPTTSCSPRTCRRRSGKIMRRLLRDIARRQGARRYDDAGGSGGRRQAQGELRREFGA